MKNGTAQHLVEDVKQELQDAGWEHGTVTAIAVGDGYFSITAVRSEQAGGFEGGGGSGGGGGATGTW